MSVAVIYLTEAFLDESLSEVAAATKHPVRVFASFEKARKAEFPVGYVVGCIPLQTGYHVFSPNLGFEFHIDAISHLPAFSYVPS